MSLNQSAHEASSLKTIKISSSFTFNKDLVALMQKNGFTLVPDPFGGIAGEQLFLELGVGELG